MKSWRVGKELRLGHHSNLSLHTSPGFHREGGGGGGEDALDMS